MTGTTIAAQVTELSAQSGGAPSPFAAEQTALAAAGPPDGVVPVGTSLPDATLLDPHGAPTTLGAAMGTHLSVLVFYRGAWCPYCNITLNTYQTALVPELRKRGVPLVAVSPQAPDGSLSMREKNGLGFAVLSDPGNVLAAAVGVVSAPSAQTRDAQLQHGLDLTTVNADGTTAIPMPTTVLLDADRVVRWIDVHPDYSTRSEPEQILGAVDAALL